MENQNTVTPSETTSRNNQDEDTKGGGRSHVGGQESFSLTNSSRPNYSIFSLAVGNVAIGTTHLDRSPGRLALVNESNQILLDTCMCIEANTSSFSTISQQQTSLNPSPKIESCLTPLTGITLPEILNAPSIATVISRVKDIFHQKRKSQEGTSGNIVVIGRNIREVLQLLQLHSPEDYLHAVEIDEFLCYQDPVFFSHSYFELHHIAEMANLMGGNDDNAKLNNYNNDQIMPLGAQSSFISSPGSKHVALNAREEALLVMKLQLQFCLVDLYFMSGGSYPNAKNTTAALLFNPRGCSVDFDNIPSGTGETHGSDPLLSALEELTKLKLKALHTVPSITKTEHLNYRYDGICLSSIPSCCSCLLKPSMIRKTVKPGVGSKLEEQSAKTAALNISGTATKVTVEDPKRRKRSHNKQKSKEKREEAEVGPTQQLSAVSSPVTAVSTIPASKTQQVQHQPPFPNMPVFGPMMPPQWGMYSMSSRTQPSKLPAFPMPVLGGDLPPTGGAPVVMDPNLNIPYVHASGLIQQQNQYLAFIHQQYVHSGQQQFGPGQQQFGPSKQQFGPSKQQPGPGQQQPGSGQPQFGGQQPTGPGQQQPGPGQQQPGPGQQPTGPGQQPPGPGQQPPGPGQQQPAPGQPQFGPGQQQFDTVRNQVPLSGALDPLWGGWNPSSSQQVNWQETTNPQHSDGGAKNTTSPSSSSKKTERESFAILDGVVNLPSSGGN